MLAEQVKLLASCIQMLKSAIYTFIIVSFFKGIIYLMLDSTSWNDNICKAYKSAYKLNIDKVFYEFWLKLIKFYHACSLKPEL